MKETDELNFDLKKTLSIFQGHLWLLVLGLLLGAGTGWLISIRIDPVYRATTKVLVTRSDQHSSSDVTAYLSDLQLAQTYLQLLNTKTILDIIADRTGIEFEPEDIKAQVIRDTQIIQIDVESTDPRQAALIANSMVDVLIEQNEVIQSGRYETMEESLKAQKAQIEKEIQNLQPQIEMVALQSVEEQKLWIESKISTLQAEKGTLQQEIAEIDEVKSPEEELLLDQKNTRLEQVQSLLTLYQDNYNNLLLVYDSPVEPQIDPADSRLALLTTTQALYEQYYVSVLSELESIHLARLQNIPNIVQIEIASVPEEPIRPVPWLNTALGAVIGFVFITGLVFLRQALDDTLKTKEAIEQLLGVPVIGLITEISKRKKDADKVHVVQQPSSPVSEDFRLLRTNLELASVEKPIRTILVASAQDHEGKSTVALNLAACLAQAGKQVTLLEADMRRPHLQSMLGLSNGTGIATLLTDHTNIEQASRTIADVSNLTIIAAEAKPSNPAELLGSEKMSQILAELRQQSDVVVIDSPPAFVADAQILASKVDAVLLVVRPGVTHVDAAQSAVEMFKRANARIVGVVMNPIPRNQGSYDGRKQYLSPN